jgi:hypothetical protein
MPSHIFKNRPYPRPEHQRFPDKNDDIQIKLFPRIPGKFTGNTLADNNAISFLMKTRYPSLKDIDILLKKISDDGYWGGLEYIDYDNPGWEYTDKVSYDYRGAADDDEPDWDGLKKRIRPWKIWDDPRGDQMSMDFFIKYLQQGDEELLIDPISFGEITHGNVDTMLQDDGFDPREVWEQYPDQFDELRFAIEDAAKYNVEDIAPLPFFVKIPGMADEPDPADEDYYDTAVQFAKANGFSEKDVDAIFSNETVESPLGIGIIVDSMENIFDKPTVSGTKVLFYHDRWNGSGYYVEKGTESYTFKSGKALADSIDHGSYSLGAIFGTRDWHY